MFCDLGRGLEAPQKIQGGLFRNKNRVRKEFEILIFTMYTHPSIQFFTDNAKKEAFLTFNPFIYFVWRR
jgi:hypothetical protein